MMHRYILIIVLLILPANGFCSTTNWQWNFGHWVYFGTSSGASDSLDSLDLPMSNEPCTGHFAIYKETGIDGWYEASGFYQYDFRSPLEITFGNSKTWRIYLWGDLSYPSQTIGLSWFPGSGISEEVLNQIEFRLTYTRPAVGVSDTHTVGEYWILNDHPDGWGTGSFAACQVENGLDGYIFDLTATVIPEPSSLLALISGIAGIGGIAWRRRR